MSEDISSKIRFKSKSLQHIGEERSCRQVVKAVLSFNPRAEFEDKEPRLMVTQLSSGFRNMFIVDDSHLTKKLPFRILTGMATSYELETILELKMLQATDITCFAILYNTMHEFVACHITLRSLKQYDCLIAEEYVSDPDTKLAVLTIRNASKVGNFASSGLGLLGMDRVDSECINHIIGREALTSRDGYDYRKATPAPPIAASVSTIGSTAGGVTEGKITKESKFRPRMRHCTTRSLSIDTTITAADPQPIIAHGGHSVHHDTAACSPMRKRRRSIIMAAATEGSLLLQLGSHSHQCRIESPTIMELTSALGDISSENNITHHPTATGSGRNVRSGADGHIYTAPSASPPVSALPVHPAGAQQPQQPQQSQQQDTAVTTKTGDSIEIITSLHEFDVEDECCSY
eukprot:CAMPEP_0175014012 /NCGR_PEP_ID=MMETSP0005-20121125/10277_1 /TAXON_ID=420556 /ORGANISM="Ochromonas sp., Strain CCMP1393" /LENGTH=403 /DNA_ID=CAMNT_0016270611 /DNA_START=15 /DNA_END=1226 /DNA_ORIENTATION=+